MAPGVCFGNVSSRPVLSAGHAKVSGTLALASGSSGLQEPTVLQSTRENTVCYRKPSDFGTSKKELDLTEDIQEGFLEEVRAELDAQIVGSEFQAEDQGPEVTCLS